MQKGDHWTQSTHAREKKQIYSDQNNQSSLASLVAAWFAPSNSENAKEDNLILCFLFSFLVLYGNLLYW